MHDADSFFCTSPATQLPRDPITNGIYLVSDVTDLGRGSGTWWFVANLLSLSPVDYVKLLINKFHAVDLRYSKEKNVLIFYFSSIEHARSYKNFVNKTARDRGFVICT